MKIRVWPVTMLGMLLCACAASPPKPLVAPAAPGAPTAVATAQKPATAYYTPEELDRRAKIMGYIVETRNAEKEYCEYSMPTDSHLTKKHCLTAEAMSLVARRQEERPSQPGGQLCRNCVQKN